MPMFLSFLLCLLLTGCASLAAAGGPLEVSVINRSTGERLPLHHHGGKLYVAGNPGDRYAVGVHNRSGRRLLAVISVDGVNVLTGETASPGQSGYVLQPYGYAEIAGWRKSLQDVAAFYFTALPDSYAARTGRPENVGVIGVAVFSERIAQPRPVPFGHAAPEPEAKPQERARAPAPAHGDSAASAESLSRQAAPRLGTGHGEREHSPTRYTRFRRASEVPLQIIAIHYDSRANLVARGIIPGIPHYTEPQPFPGRFVPDPAG